MNASASGTIANAATISNPTGVTDPNATNNSATDSDTVTAPTVTADLSVTKTNGATSMRAGGPATYTIVAANAGPNAVTGATVTDTAPAGLTFGAWTCAATAGSVCPASGSGNLAAAVSLLAGGSATFTINTSVSAAASGTITNTATIGNPTGVTDPNAANNAAADTDSVTVPTPVADLAITKTDNVSSLTPGGSTIYTIVVTNAGPAAVANAAVVDIAPSGLSFGAWTCAASAGAVCPANGSGNLNTLVSIPAGGRVTFTLPAAVSLDAEGDVTNTATVTAPGNVSDPVPANNLAADTGAAVPPQRIGIAKAVGEVEHVGPTAFEVTYTIRVANLARVPATNLQVIDSLASVFSAGGPNLSLARPVASVPSGGASPSQCAVNPAYNGVGVTNLLAGAPTLGPGQGCALTVAVRVSYPSAAAIPAAPQLNQAMARTFSKGGGGEPLAEDMSDSGSDPDGSNPGAAGDTGGLNDPTPVKLVLPRLDVTKAAASVRQADDTAFDIAYTLVVRNTSSVPARNVQVADDLGTAFMAGRPAVTILDGPTLGDGLGSLTPAREPDAYNGTTRTSLLTGTDTLLAGEEREISFTVRVRYSNAAAIPVNVELPNTAVATTTAAPGGPALTTDDSTDVTGTGASPSADDVPSPTVVRLVPRAKLAVEKTASPSVVEMGDSVGYTIRVSNTGGTYMPGVLLEDQLPLGFHYIAGSARLAAGTSSAQRIPDPDGGAGPALAFHLPAQASLGEMTLSYRVRAGVGAVQGDGVNTAQATAGTVRSNMARARVAVTSGVFTQQACIFGKVFVDVNANRVQDPLEPGIPGVQLYLTDGTAFVTDGTGNYSFCGLPPTTHGLKVDPASLPGGAVLVPGSNRNGLDGGSLFVDLKAGELHRADFIEATASAAMLEAVRARIEASPVGVPDIDRVADTQAVSGRSNKVRLLTPGAPSSAAGVAAPSSPARFVPQAGAVPLTATTTNLPDTGPEALTGIQAAVGRIELAMAAGSAVADGRSSVPVRIRLFDADGHLLKSPAVVTVEVGAGRGQPPAVPSPQSETSDPIDSDRIVPGAQVRIDGGEGEFSVQSPTDAQEVVVRLTAGQASTEGTLSFLPGGRPMLAIGIVEGMVSLTRIDASALSPVRAGDVFDQELQRFARSFADGKGLYGGRAAVFLKGKVKGGYLATLAYDSEKQDRGVLFRDIQPDAFYPIYGDASLTGFDAQTAGRFYLRVEKGRSYLLYGDFVTASPGNEAKNLGVYSRTLTGFRNRFESGKAALNLFASRDTLRQVVDEIAGRGIRARTA